MSDGNGGSWVCRCSLMPSFMILAGLGSQYPHATPLSGFRSAERKCHPQSEAVDLCVGAAILEALAGGNYSRILSGFLKEKSGGTDEGLGIKVWGTLKGPKTEGIYHSTEPSPFLGLKEREKGD